MARLAAFFLTLNLCSYVWAQELPAHLQDDGSNIPNGILIETPAEPEVAQPAPPFLCENGGEISCSPVNDWWCAIDTGCAGDIEVSFAEVYAPASLSPLGFAQPWYDHWYAELDYVKDLEDELRQWRTGALRYQDPVPTIDCNITTDFADGPKNALWKPYSENTGRPVFLLPASYQNVRVIEIFGVDGEKITNGSFRTCCPNNNRAHFDVPVSAHVLSNNAPITVRLFTGAGYECRTVEDPTRRVD